MEALDFELEISAGGVEGNYLVAARSPAGDLGGVAMRFPFDRQTLQTRLLNLELALSKSSALVRGRLLSEEEQPVQQFGRELFDCLIDGDVRGLFDATRARAAQEERHLRFVLRVRPPNLARLPWEFLYDPRRDDYLSLSTSLVRYSEVMEPARTLSVTPPLRILGMIASPADLDPLDAEQERVRLHASLESLERAGGVRLD
jgi:hypothetical protein